LKSLEDLSDRELEHYIAENCAARWFCGFGLKEDTPDHTVFSKACTRIGATVLFEIFTEMRDQLKEKGYISEVFSFIDATHLISKCQLWEERDKLIKQKYEKMNNENISKVAAVERGCHLAAIKKNNMKGKNKDLDQWISKVRAPYF
jgi:transposase